MHSSMGTRPSGPKTGTESDHTLAAVAFRFVRIRVRRLPAGHLGEPPLEFRGLAVPPNLVQQLDDLARVVARLAQHQGPFGVADD